MTSIAKQCKCALSRGILSLFSIIKNDDLALYHDITFNIASSSALSNTYITVIMNNAVEQKFAKDVISKINECLSIYVHKSLIGQFPDFNFLLLNYPIALFCSRGNQDFIYSSYLALKNLLQNSSHTNHL